MNVSLVEKYRDAAALAPEDGSGGGVTGSSAPSGSTGGSSPGGGTTSSPGPSPSSPAGSTSTATPSAPSPGPTPAGVTEPQSPGGTPEGTDFSDFNSIFEDPGERTPVPPPVIVPPLPSIAAPAQVPQAPAAPGAQPLVPPAPAIPGVATAPEGTAQPGQSGASSPGQLDPANPLVLAEALATHEEAAIAHFAQQFSLSPQELELLETNVAEAIPRLLAKTAIRVQQTFLASMGRMVPQMIQRHQEVTRRHSTNEDKFYSAWPQIDRSQLGPTVNRLGALYRQANPNAPLDQMIQELGPFVMATARIPFQGGVPAAAPGGAAGLVVQPAGGSSNGHAPPRTPPQSPFVPAAGPGVSSAAPISEENPWGFLGASD